MLLTNLHRGKVGLFLFRYLFQASLYAIWKEWNGRKFGGAHTSAAGLIKTIDKQIGNRISSLKTREDSIYQKTMVTWFSFR